MCIFCQRVKNLITLDRAVIVEGKYDKIKLENLIDTLIISTNGFRIFKDKEKLQLIRRLADQKGIIVLTDSDSAGMLIRSHLKGMIDNEKITNVYLPQILGKEKRKAHRSAEGYLGVEGTGDEIILKALSDAGVMSTSTAIGSRRVEKRDLYFWDLSGTENSSANRAELCKLMGLPQNIPTNSFLDLINSIYGYEKFSQVVEEWKQEQHKN